MQHSEHPSNVARIVDRGEDLRDQFPLGGVGARRAHHDDAVGLTQGSAGPRRTCAVGLEDDVVVADIGLVHELREPGHADVVGGGLRDRRAIEHPIDSVARQVFGGAEASDLLHHLHEQRRHRLPAR